MTKQKRKHLSKANEFDKINNNTERSPKTRQYTRRHNGIIKADDVC